MLNLGKTLGCLGGLAIGDALGMATEFLTPEQIQEHFGCVTGLVSAPPWHPHSPLIPGIVTDDTGQTLAVARAYTNEGKLNADSVTRELILWADQIGEDNLSLIIGPSTQRALEQLRHGVSPEISGKTGFTNGAAMRASVVGLVNAGQFIGAVADAEQASLPTHGTCIAIAGAAAVACAVAEAVSIGATLKTILDAGKEGAFQGGKLGEWKWGTKLESRIILAEQLVHQAKTEQQAIRNLYDFVGVDMLVAESVATAFGVILLAKGDPMHAAFLAVNMGGDTDTIAAIACAICGAWKGYEALDQALLAQIEQINKLNLSFEAKRLTDIIQVKQRMNIKGSNL